MTPIRFAQAGVRCLGLLWIIGFGLHGLDSVFLGFEFHEWSDSPDTASTLVSLLAASAAGLVMGTAFLMMSGPLGRWIAKGSGVGGAQPKLVILLRLGGLALIGASVVLGAIAPLTPTFDESLHDTYYVVAGAGAGMSGVLQALVLGLVGASLVGGSRPLACWIGGKEEAAVQDR